jgi:hypothetical protein
MRERKPRRCRVSEPRLSEFRRSHGHDPFPGSDTTRPYRMASALLALIGITTVLASSSTGCGSTSPRLLRRLNKVSSRHSLRLSAAQLLPPPSRVQRSLTLWRRSLSPRLGERSAMHPERVTIRTR